MAVDTLGHLLTLLVTPANEQDRAQVAQLAKQVQEVTGESVEVAFVDQGYTGQTAAEDAQNRVFALKSSNFPMPNSALCSYRVVG